MFILLAVIDKNKLKDYAPQVRHLSNEGYEKFGKQIADFILY